MDRFETKCRYFSGERPCRLHKADLRECKGCPDFAPKGTRILIIKTSSAGDVLRTTSVLKAFKELYPESHVTWIVNGKCRAVLANNPFIDRVIVSSEAAAVLEVMRFDLAVALDVDVPSAALMSVARAGLKKGFGLDGSGTVYPINAEAVPWFEMSVSDKLKKENALTYHDIIHDICGLRRNDNRPVLVIPEEVRMWAGKFAEDKGLAGKGPLIGVNLGSSDRWMKKSPKAGKWSGIIRGLSEKVKGRCLILAGPAEKEKYGKVLAGAPETAVGAGTDNPFGCFAALVGLCDVLVTPDTLALHVATALGKKIVALFGPTSSAEIGLYGKGRKIAPEMECLCCYRETCDKAPDCMDSLPVEKIISAVKELINE